LNQENILDLKIQISEKEEKKIKELIPGIIGGNTEQMLRTAQTIGNYLGQELPKKERLYIHQIRKIFGLIKRIQMETFDTKKVALLKPHMVFIATKGDSTIGIQYLKDILIEAIDNIGQDEKRFKNFIDFFESILAYHQAAEKM
jgi:CRISPR-associated protein Csm2